MPSGHVDGRRSGERRGARLSGFDVDVAYPCPPPESKTQPAHSAAQAPAGVALATHFRQEIQSPLDLGALPVSHSVCVLQHNDMQARASTAAAPLPPPLNDGVWRPRPGHAQPRRLLRRHSLGSWKLQRRGDGSIHGQGIGSAISKRAHAARRTAGAAVTHPIRPDPLPASCPALHPKEPSPAQPAGHPPVVQRLDALVPLAPAGS